MFSNRPQSRTGLQPNVNMVHLLLIGIKKADLGPDLPWVKLIDLWVSESHFR